VFHSVGVGALQSDVGLMLWMVWVACIGYRRRR